MPVSGSGPASSFLDTVTTLGIDLTLAGEIFVRWSRLFYMGDLMRLSREDLKDVRLLDELVKYPRVRVGVGLT
jgi:hypothetical protein